MLTFSEFLKNDEETRLQREIIYNLNVQFEYLNKIQIQIKLKGKGEKSFTSYMISKSDKIIKKMQNIHILLRDNINTQTSFFDEIEWKNSVHRQHCWFFLNSMLVEDPKKVIMMNLISRGFDPKNHVFEIESLPTYTYIAALLKLPQKELTLDPSYCWNGISINHFNKDYELKDTKIVTTVTQLRLLSKLKRIHSNVEKKHSESSSSGYIGFYNAWFEKRKGKKYGKMTDWRIKTANETIVLQFDLFCLRKDLIGIKQFIKKDQFLALNTQFAFMLQADTDISTFLLYNGIDPKQRYELITPLHIAAIAGNLELVALYLELGLHPDLADSSGFSPVFYAYKYGNYECAAYLLKEKYNNLQRLEFKKPETKQYADYIEKFEDLKNKSLNHIEDKDIQYILNKAKGIKICGIYRNSYIKTFNMPQKSPSKTRSVDRYLNGECTIHLEEILHVYLKDGYEWINEHMFVKKGDYNSKLKQKLIEVCEKNTIVNFFSALSFRGR